MGLLSLTWPLYEYTWHPSTRDSVDREQRLQTGRSIRMAGRDKSTQRLSWMLLVVVNTCKSIQLLPQTFSNDHQEAKLGRLCHWYGSICIYFTVQSSCAITFTWFHLLGSPVFLRVALKNWEEPGDEARLKVQSYRYLFCSLRACQGLWKAKVVSNK